MKRRDFMRLAAASPLLAGAPALFAATATSSSSPQAGGWRSFELSYEVDLSAQTGAGRVWLPLPADAGDYQTVHSIKWADAPAGAALNWDPEYQATMFSAELPAAASARRFSVTAVVSTRDRNRSAPGPVRPLTEDVARYLAPTLHMPNDGIVATTATKIVQGIKSPDARARAIYDWVVDNAFRNPKTRGCGLGDIKFMLETGDLGGKCADINSLFVGLARAAGLPAREMYGVRVATSSQFKSLGKVDDISKAQHCRAEYFSPRYGWVAVDPADVRKAVLEEKLPLTDPRIVALRERLFGYWEMNWVGFNTARDFALAPPAHEPLPYLMYPYGEFGEVTLDGREPDHFNFKLTSREMVTGS
jgi:transglutaminase-like putative cysteine protease